MTVFLVDFYLKRINFVCKFFCLQWFYAETRLRGKTTSWVGLAHKILQKMTVRYTSKVRPNYKEWEQNFFHKHKFLINWGSLWEMTYTWFYEYLCFICMHVSFLHQSSPLSPGCKMITWMIYTRLKYLQVQHIPMHNIWGNFLKPQHFFDKIGIYNPPKRGQNNLYANKFLRQFTIDHKWDSHLCRNLEALNPAKPIFWKYVKVCL